MKLMNMNSRKRSDVQAGVSARNVLPMFVTLLLVAGAVRGEVRAAKQDQPAGGVVARSGQSVDPAAGSRLAAAFDAERIGGLDLRFERNEGQMDARARFAARGIGHGFFITAEGAVLVLDREAAGGRETRVMRLLMEGGSHDATIEGERELPGTANYFMGADPSKWRAGVRNFERVRVRSAWPGIDLVYYGNGGRLEYDFVAGPGADLSAIRIRMEGTDGLKVDKSGDLILAVGSEHLRQARPVVYQEVDGRRREIAGQYVVQGDRVRFDVGAYDPRATLVVDPVLDYSTYLGGSDYDECTGIAVDASGAAYVVGNTNSTDFPTTPGVFQSIYQEGTDVFVTKIAADGQTLVYQSSSGAFFLRNTNTVGDVDLTLFFGSAGGNFVAVAGDWGGDGLDGVGLMDLDDGALQLKNVADSGPMATAPGRTSPSRERRDEGECNRADCQNEYFHRPADPALAPIDAYPLNSYKSAEKES